jgi:hypothetical protein
VPFTDAGSSCLLIGTVRGIGAEDRPSDLCFPRPVVFGVEGSAHIVLAQRPLDADFVRDDVRAEFSVGEVDGCLGLLFRASLPPALEAIPHPSDHPGGYLPPLFNPDRALPSDGA